MFIDAATDVLIIQHVPWEQPALLGRVLTERGLSWRCADITRSRDRSELGPVTALAGLVLLGGPMGALDVADHPGLAVEAELIRDCAAVSIPIFGICLGHQLIATALGGALHPGANREIGVGRVRVITDGLLGPAGTTQPVLHWHGDVVDPPPGATVLASTPGTPNQAFQLGGTVFGTQFHLEADRATVSAWLDTPEMAADLTATERDRLLDDFDAEAESITAAGRRMFEAYADAVSARAS
ncbi:MAG TPA: gamma-glutamyl-gamma-aminobutyrate hydrolase family protein [Microlunatus sp.]|nr:gamma-glutamyl-gamma-aminobutyrate hydrolase family protein [Microlunatus sp.]